MNTRGGLCFSIKLRCMDPAGLTGNPELTRIGRLSKICW
jgi:hypothetical protein